MRKQSAKMKRHSDKKARRNQSAKWKRKERQRRRGASGESRGTGRAVNVSAAQRGMSKGDFQGLMSALGQLVSPSRREQRRGGRGE